MSDWQIEIARRIAWVESKIDTKRLNRLIARGTDKTLTIVPYIGHATARTVYLRGRVLLSKNIKVPAPTDSIWTNLANTYRRFESDEIPHARVQLSLGGNMAEALCDTEGFFHFEMPIVQPLDRTNFWQDATLSVLQTPVRNLDTLPTRNTPAPLVVPPLNAQYAVVSDLDDTVMRTDVLNVFKMFKNTLLRNAHTRLPFEGVAAFYRALHNGTTRTHNPIFYVSSSPWNLYDVIIDFYKIRGIPLGPVYLRNLGITEEQLFAQKHMSHKVNYIQTLLDEYPHLPFILIGDSGQKDAHIYYELVRRNPQRISAVYIRDVARLKRAHVVEQVSRQVRQLGTEMLLVKDTSEAAEHAVRRGFISPSCLPQIRRECHRDSEQATFMEKLLEE